jgi:hypothetical protein
MHDYEIDWQPDTITWSIDGKVVRTLQKESTWNATANRYDYPQTPANVQLSLWPGGLSTNGEGTIEWAGGLVEWDSQYMTNGYYYAQFDSVSIQCYDPPPGANDQGSKSYIFTDSLLTNQSVEISNNNTILKSFLGSGLNMTAGGGADGSKSNITVPGLQGGGTGNNGNRGDNSTSSNGAGGSSGTGSGSGSGGAASASASGAASTGFVQGNGGEGGSSNGAGSVGASSETVMKGSLFAVVVAIVGLCVL